MSCPPGKVHVWMAMDPQTARIMVQHWEFDETSFPLGARGRGWPQRELEVSEDDYDSLLCAAITPSEQDRLHQDWWDTARRDTRDPLWPEVPR